jgi:hypothetical protein
LSLKSKVTPRSLTDSSHWIVLSFKLKLIFWSLVFFTIAWNLSAHNEPAHSNRACNKFTVLGILWAHFWHSLFVLFSILMLWFICEISSGNHEIISHRTWIQIRVDILTSDVKCIMLIILMPGANIFIIKIIIISTQYDTCWARFAFLVFMFWWVLYGASCLKSLVIWES